jgi:hypothetical protein
MENPLRKASQKSSLRDDPVLNLTKELPNAPRTGLGIGKLQGRLLPKRVVFLLQPFPSIFTGPKHLCGSLVNSNEPQNALRLIGLETPFFLAPTGGPTGNVDNVPKRAHCETEFIFEPLERLGRKALSDQADTLSRIGFRRQV